MWLNLIIIYNILFLFIYFVVVLWLGGRKFSFKEMLNDWVMSPFLFYEVIKDFGFIAFPEIIKLQYDRFKWKLTHKKIYDPVKNDYVIIKR